MHSPGQPDHGFERIAEDAGAEAGLLDRAVARDDSTSPAKIDFIGGVPFLGEDDPRIGRVVGDGVGDHSGRAGGRIAPLDACVQDLDRSGDMIGRGEHLVACHPIAAKRRFHDEGDLSLDARLDEAAGGDDGAVGEQHVVEQDAAVRDVPMPSACCIAFDVRPIFQPIFFRPAASFLSHQGLLDRIGAVHVETGMLERQEADLFGLCAPL